MERTQAKKKGFNNRFGRIYVSARIPNVDVVIDALYKIRFFPVRVEYLFVENRFEMIGYSERFAKIPPGERYPTYELIIKTNPKTGELQDVKVEELHDE